MNTHKEAEANPLAEMEGTVLRYIGFAIFGKMAVSYSWVTPDIVAGSQKEKCEVCNVHSVQQTN